jgi:fibronectin type 3 domain-containing protein
MKIIRWFIVVWFLASALYAAPAATKEKSAVWAYSDGKGVISLFWLPGEKWPAEGWKVERIGADGTKVLESKVLPGSDKEALNKIGSTEADEIQKFAREVASGKMDKDKSEMAVLIFGMKGAIDIPFGYAAGLRYIDREGTRGKRIYRITENSSGGESANTLQIDPLEATAPIKKIDELSIAELYEGVGLSWKLPKGDIYNPPVGYLIERKDPDGTIERLTREPAIISDDLDKSGTPLFVDKNAPLGAEVTYRVYAVGLFANLSLPAEKKIVIKDTKALESPENLVAKEGKEEVSLAWKENGSAGYAGYLIERSLLHDGPYVPLTSEGLSRSTDNYTDKKLRGGTAYYYRIRSIAASGEVGHPSYPVMAQPVSEDPPSRVKELKADAGRSIVTLTWEKSPKAVAGYIVYRREQGADKWSQMTTYVIPETRYDDHVGDLTYGTYQYRVSAVGFDSKEGETSETVTVTLADTISPNPPYITDVDGSNGQVKISFKVAPPYEDIERLYLVRSVSETDAGLVIGGDISPKATDVTDTFVKYGQRYWYRMVAVDKAGNRSDLGRAKTVVVLNPPIPIPDRPKLRFEKSPIAHIVIHVGKIPTRLSAVVQRQIDAKREWIAITGSITEEEVVDMKLPALGKIRYRVVYQAENGARGEASEIAEFDFSSLK